MSEETAPQILRRIWIACRDMLDESGDKSITSYEVAERVQLDHALVADGLIQLGSDYLDVKPEKLSDGETKVNVLRLEQEYEAQ